MPVFDAGKPLVTGSGWGCSCPAFKIDEPTPEQALAALARSATVTVTFGGIDQDGNLCFRAWTEPGNVYEVTYGAGEHGWCKHSLACLSNWLPWYHQLALGASGALDEIERLRKENKRLGKEIAKRDREIAKLRG